MNWFVSYSLVSLFSPAFHMLRSQYKKIACLCAHKNKIKYKNEMSCFRFIQLKYLNILVTKTTLFLKIFFLLAAFDWFSPPHHIKRQKSFFGCLDFPDIYWLQLLKQCHALELGSAVGHMLSILKSWFEPQYHKQGKKKKSKKIVLSIYNIVRLHLQL